MRRRGRRGLNLGPDDIILSFLNRHKSVSFVITILVESDGSMRSGPEHLKAVSAAYISPVHPTAGPLVQILQENLCRHLPRPETTPINAYSLQNEGKSFNGGGTMSGKTIKVSARAVIGVLSGLTRQQDFIRDNQPFANFFAKMFCDGRLMDEVIVERSADRDDDWLEFSFSDPDPAIRHLLAVDVPETSTAVSAQDHYRLILATVGL